MKNSTEDYAKTMLDTVKKAVERAGYSLLDQGSKTHTEATAIGISSSSYTKNCPCMEEKKNLWLQIYKELRRHYPIEAFDVIVKSMKEHKHDASMVNTISNEAESEGVVLYG